MVVVVMANAERALQEGGRVRTEEGERERERGEEKRLVVGRLHGRSVLRFSYANRIVELEEYGFG